MAKIVKIFDFTTSAQGWTNAGGDTINTELNAEPVFKFAPSARKISLISGKIKGQEQYGHLRFAQGTSMYARYIEGTWSGTYEDLGVPAGSTITAIRGMYAWCIRFRTKHDSASAPRYDPRANRWAGGTESSDQMYGSQNILDTESIPIEIPALVYTDGSQSISLIGVKDVYIPNDDEYPHYKITRYSGLIPNSYEIRQSTLQTLGTSVPSDEPITLALQINLRDLSAPGVRDGVLGSTSYYRIQIRPITLEITYS